MAIGWTANQASLPDGPASGDLAGTYPDPIVDGLQGDPVSAAAPAPGNTLVFTGGVWTPTTLTAGSVGADPTGTASAAVAAHVALPDPHTQYTTAAEAAAAAPVQSVNGQTNVVVLTATNVGASGPLGATNVQQGLDRIPPDYRVVAGVGATISGSGFVAYITATTPALAAGTYAVSWSIVNLCSALGGTPGVQVLLAATQVPTSTITTGIAPANASRLSITTGGEYVHAGGTIAVLMQVNRFAGTGNIIPQSGRIEIRRIA